jgi:hypothetical protein
MTQSGSPSHVPPETGYAVTVRIGDWDVRPLGGSVGCLLMIVVSLLLSVLLTVLVNLVF